MNMPADMTISRRALLTRAGTGIGGLALCYLLHTEDLNAAESKRRHDLTPKSPHLPAKAKAVIQLVQNGGPSQMDLFDPKPVLDKRSGQKHDEKLEVFQVGSDTHELMGSLFRFERYGHCGMEMADVLPHIGSLADQWCMIRSMYSEHNNHSEALLLLQTGKIFPGRPAMGSWISYALGTENQNLPAYIVLRDPAGYNTSGNLLWSSGWLPTLYRGTEFSTAGSPVHNLRPAQAMPKGVQKENLDLLAKLNEAHRQQYPDDSNLDARIRNYELAARMQLAAAETLDLARETEATKKLYGLDNPVTRGYGLRCLLARRLVESGVRFVQIHPPIKPQFQPWDTHRNTKGDLEKICPMTDQPSAALVRDLCDRGLLDSTIVLWSGEFGRLPIRQHRQGRDHNRNAFTLLVTGGGFKRGYIHGATDELGYRAVKDRVSVPSLHATMLHQLGIDHDRLTFQHHGRPETLTDSVVTGAKIVKQLLA